MADMCLSSSQALLQDRLGNMPSDWWLPDVQHIVSANIANRESNLAAVKPGVNTMFLLFSTRNADRIWHLPLWDYFKDTVEPLLDATIGPEAKANVVRLQLAQMTPGAVIKPHKDQGPWAEMCVPVFTWVCSAIWAITQAGLNR
jgi:hypothetical protein